MELEALTRPAGSAYNPAMVSGLISGSSLPLNPCALQASILQVGPGRQFATPCAALAVAADGDTIQIDPVLYKGDVCASRKTTWRSRE
jgi:hypothetical protein